MKTKLFLICFSFVLLLSPGRSMADEVLHAHVGDIVKVKGHLTIRDIAKHQCYDWRHRESLDMDINSPKSVRIHPNGKKYYVNSLEGDRTVVYEF